MIRKPTFAASFKKFLGAAAVGAALCTASAAQAGVLDFEAPVDSPYIFAGDTVTVGNYVVQGYGLDGLVGSISNTEGCFGVQCPINNATTFYSGLADGYMVFQLANGGLFSLGSLDASFIGMGETYPAVAGLLYLTGFGADGFVNSEAYLNLAGPTSGSFNFASYDLTGFGGGSLFSAVRIASYACNAAGDCDRNTNQANFAVDNIVTVDANAVPEPGTFALLGLGLAGLAAFTRRRAA